MRVDKIPLLLCFAGAMALAQYPGQYPPGQYPPGQYPPGQTGQCPRGRFRRATPAVSRPTRLRLAMADRRRIKRTWKPALLPRPSALSAALRRIRSSLSLADHRIVWYRVTSTTKFMKNNKEVDASAFALGDHVTLDSTSDDEDMYTAVEMRWDKEGDPEERAHAGETWDLPKLEGGPVAKGNASASGGQREPGDERPVLHRANWGDDDKTADAAPAKTQDGAKAQDPPEPVDNRPSTMIRPPIRRRMRTILVLLHCDAARRRLARWRICRHPDTILCRTLLRIGPLRQRLGNQAKIRPARGAGRLIL